MGFLPPNVANEDPQRFPAARLVELRREATEYTGVGPADGYSAALPNATTPWFTGASLLGHYTTVVYDYASSVSRVGQSAGSGPHIRGGPSEGLIFVTAPLDRPLPYVAWANTMFRANTATTPPNTLRARLGLVRSNPASESVEYRVLDEDFTITSNTLNGELITASCFGFDVVPPGQTYKVWSAADAPSSSISVYLWDDGSQAGDSHRHHFGVMTF